MCPQRDLSRPSHKGRGALLQESSQRPLIGIGKVTRYVTTLNPKAGLDYRGRVRRQPVVQTQILVVQGLLCGNSSEKVPYRGKGGQNTGTACLALRLGVVLYLPKKEKGPEPPPQQRGRYDWTTRGTTQWKWMAEAPCRTSCAPLASPCLCLF